MVILLLQLLRGRQLILSKFLRQKAKLVMLVAMIRIQISKDVTILEERLCRWRMKCSHKKMRNLPHCSKEGSHKQMSLF
uniref:Uncharacterized protein n=1 Tax=Arundo donax TaxID=35708 RepID=A0A0A9G8Q0_ARUDO